MIMLCPVSQQRIKVLQIIQLCRQITPTKNNEFLGIEAQSLVMHLVKEGGGARE